MRPLNECQNELFDGEQYTVWIIAPWDDYRLTDGETYTWKPKNFTSYEERIIGLSGFGSKCGFLAAPLEYIVVDI